jgi:hypothetical protein
VIILRIHSHDIGYKVQLERKNEYVCKVLYVCEKKYKCSEEKFEVLDDDEKFQRNAIVDQIPSMSAPAAVAFPIPILLTTAIFAHGYGVNFRSLFTVGSTF